jgi:hypothetical protein
MQSDEQEQGHTAGDVAARVGEVHVQRRAKQENRSQHEVAMRWARLTKHDDELAHENQSPAEEQSAEEARIKRHTPRGQQLSGSPEQWSLLEQSENQVQANTREYDHPSSPCVLEDPGKVVDGVDDSGIGECHEHVGGREAAANERRSRRGQTAPGREDDGWQNQRRQAARNEHGPSRASLPAQHGQGE